MTAISDEELEQKLDELLHDIVPGGIDGENWQRIDEAKAAIMSLIASHDREIEREAWRSGIEEANSVLFHLLPTGDLEAWAILKAVEEFQSKMTDRINELKSEEGGSHE